MSNTNNNDSGLDDLRRIVTSFNPFVWATPQQQDHEAPFGTSYYWLDQIGTTAELGDTALHRLVALHATRGEDVTTFLRDAKQHQKSVWEKKNIIKSHNNNNNNNNNNDDNNLAFSSSSATYDDTSLPPNPKRICRQEEVLVNPLQQTHRSGITALHVALFRNSYHVSSVVKALLDQYPELASIPMSCGSLPLHVYMQHSLTINSNVLHCLLDAFPQAASTQNVQGETPLSLLWRNVLRFRWARDWEVDGHVPESMVGDKSWMTVMAPDEFLNYCLRLIRASAVVVCPHRRQQQQQQQQQCNEQQQQLSWHTICQAPCCPPLLIRMLLWWQHHPSSSCAADVAVQNHDNDDCSLFPQQLGSLVTRDDTHGRLPLHWAARTTPCRPVFHEGRSVVELVLDAAKDAATVYDGQGRLPFHHLVLCQWHHSPSTVRALLQHHPDALAVPDPVTCLCPAVQYATLNSDLLDVQYELIRAFPPSIQVAV